MTLAEKLSKQALEKRQMAQTLAAKEGVSEAELAQVDQAITDAEALEAQAKAAAQREARLAGNGRAIAALSEVLPRRTAADEGREPLIGKPAFLNDPKRGYSSMRAFLQDVMRAKHGRVSEQIRSLRPGASYLDGLDVDLRATAGSDESSTFYDPSLGAMVPSALLGPKETPPPEDPFPDTFRVDINVPVVEILARVDKDHSTSVSGGLRMYRRAESQAGTSSRLKTEKVVLRADSLIGVTYETEELLRDAPGLVFGMIERGMRDESMNVRCKEVIGGDGVGRNLGFRNSGAVVTVPKETGQKAGTIVFENLVNMLARSWGRGRWIANRTCLPQLAKLNGGTNGLIWQPSAREGIPGTLLGDPLVFTEYCPVVGAAGDIMRITASEYIEVVRQDLETEESIHVRFLENERAFRFTQRRGGAPWWRSALTPTAGDTLSPFVELAVRS